MAVGTGSLLRAVIVALLLGAGTGAAAQAQPQVAEVNGVPDPSYRSYAGLLKGIDLFERYRAQAPKASLRFKLVAHPSDRASAPLALNIVHQDAIVPLPLGEDDTFSLPYYASLAEGGARVVANRRSDTLQWLVEVRTPGLAPGTRRLGDLRLECHVSIVGFVIHFPITPGNLALTMVDKPCAWRGASVPFLAERPVFGVSLVTPARRMNLSNDMLYGSGVESHVIADLIRSGNHWRYLRDRVYRLPLFDASWPDDTLVVFDFMDDDTASSSSLNHFTDRP